jgi:Polysaccharide lyase
METGSLADWYAPSTGPTGDYGGGLFNSGRYAARASTDKAHSGRWALKATIWTPSSPTSGVRAFRWKEVRTHRELYYSIWVYLPQPYTMTGNPNTGRFWNLLQFKSRTANNTRDDPVWAFYTAPDGHGGLYLRAGWGWGGTQLAGPYPNSKIGGKFYEPRVRMPLPVGRWVHLETLLRESKGFDGGLTLWQDGVQLFNFNGIRTSYANCKHNSWCADNAWSVNLYSDGLFPNPATVYFDDAAIATSYIP